jgi:glutathione S-transferase
MPHDFKLHGSPHSQFTYKVALMLRLCGVAFDFRYVSFQKGVHRMPEFRALSRWGQVPVLEHRGRTLLQSAAILEYLADALAKFAATDPDARLRAREWLYWDADRLAPPISGCYGVSLAERKLLPLSFDPVIVDWYRRRADAALTSLDATLDGRMFLAASNATIADICCFSSVAFAAPSGIDLGGWPHLSAWIARIEALPRFKAPFDLLAMTDAEIGAA